MAARLRGLQGVVIDGAVRDHANIRRDRLPVFARAVVPNAGGAEYAGETGIPIQCGGLVVNPGDWVVGDEDGVVVIPADRLASVMKTAAQLLEVEKKIGREIRRGKDLAAILRYDELLKRKSREAFLRQKLVEEEEMATAMAPIAILTDHPDEPYDQAPAGSSDKPAIPQSPKLETPTPKSAAETVTAVPAARSLAKELGIDLNSVVGTGPRGLITKNDVERFVAEKAGSKPPPEPGS